MPKLVTWRTLTISVVWAVFTIVDTGVGQSIVAMAGEILSALATAFIVVHTLKGAWIMLRGEPDDGGEEAA